MSERFYTGREDCDWLRETALHDYEVPAFESFILTGNEDCPLTIALYSAPQPLHTDEPVAKYELRMERHTNLSEYYRL